MVCPIWGSGHNNNNNDECYTGVPGAVRCLSEGGSCSLVAGNYQPLPGVSVWMIDQL